MMAQIRAGRNKTRLRAYKNSFDTSFIDPLSVEEQQTLISERNSGTPNDAGQCTLQDFDALIADIDTGKDSEDVWNDFWKRFLGRCSVEAIEAFSRLSSKSEEEKEELIIESRYLHNVYLQQWRMERDRALQNEEKAILKRSEQQIGTLKKLKRSEKDALIKKKVEVERIKSWTEEEKELIGEEWRANGGTNNECTLDDFNTLMHTIITPTHDSDPDAETARNKAVIELLWLCTKERIDKFPGTASDDNINNGLDSNNETNTTNQFKYKEEVRVDSLLARNERMLKWRQANAERPSGSSVGSASSAV